MDVSRLSEVLGILTVVLEKTPVPHGEGFRGQGVVISVYRTGKIVLQGRDEDDWYRRLTSKLEAPSVNVPESVTVFPRIGTDESGKGDFFGPLVCAGFLLRDARVATILSDIGVMDSKRISDRRIPELAKQIERLGDHESVVIMPPKYNELYEQMQNLNHILAWSHSRVIENLLSRTDCGFAVADQFGDEQLIRKALFSRGRQICLSQTHRAERDIAVAAASVLARNEFLARMRRLEDSSGFVLPRGSGEEVLIAGQNYARMKGLGALTLVAKTHFRTYREVKQTVLRE